MMKFAKSYEPGDKEPEIYAAWEASGAFRPKVPQYPVNDASSRGVDAEKGLDQSKYYSIVMPPPNANGNLHIGHGLTVALEDSLTRYYRLRGRSAWYIPGADHAGFETWVVYEKSLEKIGKSRFEYSRDELYAQVWDFVEEQRGNMELQLRALGASCAWDDLTFTLDENVVARVYKTFEKMWNDGMIYRGEKLVNYCSKHRTAFADIEVEHKDEKGMLWEIAYPIVEDDSNQNFSEARPSGPSLRADGAQARRSSASSEKFDVESSSALVVSTTRPETLFGDVAVAVNPEDERYKDLIGKHVRLPLTKREIPVIADEHADMEYGTGVVKITPAHDYDDFEVGERHDLPRVQVIGEDGLMLDAAGPNYAGLTTEECRKKVLKDLKEQGLLRGEKKIEHAVAHCYKCGTVIEPMLKEQWFIDVEKLAELAIERLEKGEIKFFPASKKKVLVNYLRGLKDWNISRQIPWGIAIPMFRKVNEDATDSPDWVFDTRTNLTEIEVGGVKYMRDEDTFDTWFSSAHWPMVCTDWVEGVPNPYYPLNVMETGADILFAWVARMIMIGVYVTGEVPFREVYLHGLVLDEHGQKMSKSKGNVINPMELVTKYGSDAFRLGILRGRSAGMNQAFSENSVVSGRNLCNKLWNVARLVDDIVSEDDDFDTCTTLNTGEDWICRELDVCREKVELDMLNYRFAEAVETLYSTIWDKYADWFLESQKIYRNSPLLKKTLEMILVMLHPFAPFVTEAIWQNLSWTEDMIITQKWPAKLEYDPMTAGEFERIREVVNEARATLQVIEGGKRWKILYGDDSLVAENAELICKLTGVPAVESCEGQPRGLRLATMNSEAYLDVPEKVVAKYRATLEEKILAVGRELDALNARMMNPAYVDKAPVHLVKQTQDGIKEKQALIERLKKQLEVI
ncbi:valine--tRNA ligase [Candidatus Saccharibacteria bacterium]|nr:valine--tRNA ligase [Candidatus Saccharibacteria bacterium]